MMKSLNHAQRETCSALNTANKFPCSKILLQETSGQQGVVYKMGLDSKYKQTYMYIVSILSFYLVNPTILHSI